MKARSARLRHLVYHEDGCAGTKGSGERALKKRRTDEEREAEPSPEEREELRDKAKTAKSYEWFTVSRELFNEMRRDTRCVMHVKETPVGFVMHHPAVDMQDYWGRLHTSVLRTGEMQYFTRHGSAVLVCCPTWVRRGYVNVCIMGEFPETPDEAASKQARIQDFLAHRGEFAYLDELQQQWDCGLWGADPDLAFPFFVRISLGFYFYFSSRLYVIWYAFFFILHYTMLFLYTTLYYAALHCIFLLLYFFFILHYTLLHYATFFLYATLFIFC